MPTPTSYSPLVINGVVPGTTWADFEKNFASVDPSLWGATVNVSGLGDVGAVRQFGQQNNGEMSGFTGLTYPTGTPTYDYESGILPDGTVNQFYQGPNGELMSHNQTKNDDSFLSKLVFDTLVPAAIQGISLGGMGAALGAAAGGVNTAAGLGASSGGANVGAGFASTPGLASAAGGSTGLGELGSALSNAPVSVSDPTATMQYASGNTPGTLQNVAETAANSGASTVPQASNWYDPLTNAWKSATDWYNGINPLLRTAAGTALTPLLQGSGGDGGPSGTGQSFSDAGYSVANNIPYSGNSNDSFVPNLSTNNGGSSINPFSAISRLYNTISGNGGDGATSDDYWNLASTAARIGSGFLNANAASNAANQLTASSNQANELANRIFNQNTALNAPYVSAGAGAIGKLANLNGLNGTAAQTSAANGMLTSDPGYQFRLDQGTRAVGNGAAASGMLGSGRYLKDLNNYAQGQASQEYGNAYNRLYNIAGIGQSAANNQAALGSAFSNQYGNNLTSGAGAQASGTVGSANALTNALGGVLNDYGSQNMLTRLLNSNLNGYYAR